MKKKVIYLSVILLLVLDFSSYSQEVTKSNQDTTISALFSNQEILSLKLNYSNRDIKQKTNDSTYLKSELSYQQNDGSWKKLAVKLRARGKNRLKNCYFAPIKIKIKKKKAVGTLFEGNKKLKLVLPCLIQRDNDDNILKEYLAYKLYELITPYHYKTRLVSIDYTEIKGNNSKEHSLKGILLEDIQIIADRFNGNIIERKTHPLAMDDVSSIQNDFFQFMIGNTDFSTAYQHNQKLLFIDKNIIPIPYDFDMSGLVNASYAIVSSVNDQQPEITNVTQRLFRGFKRDANLFHNVKVEFLDKKDQMLELIDSLELYFNNPKEFSKAKDYILSFFEIIEDRQKYNRSILFKARTK